MMQTKRTSILGWTKDQLTAVVYTETYSLTDGEIIGAADEFGKREVNQRVRELAAEKASGTQDAAYLAKSEARVSLLFGRA